MSEQVFLPSYSIGDNIYEKVDDICSNYGKTAIVIGGKTSLMKIKDELVKSLVNSKIDLIDFVWFGGNATKENIDYLQSLETVKKADMIFAVGGGKSMDTSKALANILNKPVFTFPTIASNCAPVTSLCVLYGENGVSFYQTKRPPIHCFIHTKIISQAPIEYLRAGIGDALSKQFEVCFNTRNRILNHTNSLGVQIAKDCSERLLYYGVKAFNDAKEHRVSEALEQVFLTIIINTGLVSVLVDMNYNSSLAHSLYLAKIRLPHCNNHMHGEIVSLGVVLLLIIDKAWEKAKEVYSFNQKIGLPLSLKDLEIEDVNQLVDLMIEDKYLKFAPFEITKTLLKESINDLTNFRENF